MLLCRMSRKEKCTSIPAQFGCVWLKGKKGTKLMLDLETSEQDAAQSNQDKGLSNGTSIRFDKAREFKSLNTKSLSLD